MKKFLMFLLAMAAVVAMPSCGDDGGDNGGETDTYNITVADGTATVDGKIATTARKGKMVTLQNNAPAEGFKFSTWEVEEGDVTITNNKFVMPEKDVKIKAIFVELGDDLLQFIVDDNFRDYLRNNFDADGDGLLSAAEGEVVTVIDISDLGITTLEGIEQFENLEQLACKGNALESKELDMSWAFKLTYLNCESCGLESMNVSGCPELDVLSCRSNSLAVVDVAACPVIRELYCDANIPLTALDVSGKTSLEKLHSDCPNGSLASVNVTGCTALKDLRVQYNPLTTIDVSTNTALEILFAMGCQLSGNLDYSANTVLKEYSCGLNSGVTGLNFGSNRGLERLSCSFSDVSSLDATSMPAMKDLTCEMCRIPSLDISQCTAIERLRCGSQKTGALALTIAASQRTWFNGQEGNTNVTVTEI